MEVNGLAKPEKYNIDKYRQQQNRKRIIKKALVIFVILLIGVVIAFVIEELIQKNAHIVDSGVQFPINLKGVHPTSLQTSSQGLIVTGETEHFFYNLGAQKDNSRKHGLSNPVVKVQDNKIMTYDQGGRTVRLETRNGLLYNPLETQEQILFAELSETDYIAMATFEDRYNGSLTIYNHNMEQIYKYKDSQSYMMAFDFIDNQRGILATQQVKDGNFNTIIYGLDFHKKKETEFLKLEIPNMMVYDVKVLSNESIQVVGDIGLITLDKKGEIINTYTYQNDIRFIWDGSRNYILALENIVDANDTDILIFSNEGEVKSQAKINGEAIDVFCDGNQIVLLDKNNIYEYNTSLELLNTYPNLNKYVEIAVYGGKIYGMSSERLDKIGEN